MALKFHRQKKTASGSRDASGGDRDASARPTDTGGGDAENATAAGRSSIDNVGRWPVRVTDFVLNEPYEQPPVDYLELFFIRSGSFLHESEAGRQTLRDGSVIISHPGNRQILKHPENCRLSRIRFLPEWLSADFGNLIASPFAASAITGRQFFELPEKESIYVFSARPGRFDYLLRDIDLLRELLTGGADIGVLTRITLVKILLQVGEEFGHFLRRRGGLDLPDSFPTWFERIETRLRMNAAPREALDEELLAGLDAGSADDFDALLKKHTGLGAEDYLLRRRLDHAACRLLTSELRTGIIARDLGFSDSADLTRKFENRYRVSPAVYRQKFAPPAK